MTKPILFFLSLANWRGMWREARAMMPLLALMIWIFASALWSIDPNNTLHRAFHMADHMVFATYLMARFGWREIITFLTRCYGVILVFSLGAVLLLPDLGLSNLGGSTPTHGVALSRKRTPWDRSPLWAF